MQRSLTTNIKAKCCPPAVTVVPGEDARLCNGINWKNGLLQSWPYSSQPITSLTFGEGVQLRNLVGCSWDIEFLWEGQNINVQDFELCGLEVEDGIVQQLPGIRCEDSLGNNIELKYSNYPHGIPSLVTAQMVEDFPMQPGGIYEHEFVADLVGQPNPDLVFEQQTDPDKVSVPVAMEFHQSIGLTQTYDPETCTLTIINKPTSLSNENVPFLKDIYCDCGNGITRKLRLKVIKYSDSQYEVIYDPLQAPVDPAQWTVTGLNDGATFTNLNDAINAINIVSALGSTNCVVTCE